MARKLKTLGHTVKGALAAYLAPRLAADRALKPGELDAMLLAVAPAPYKQQIPVIADSVKKFTKDRLAKDASVEDLAELLEALGGEDFDEDDELGEDFGKPVVKDDDMAEDDGPGEQLMAILSKCNLPPDTLEQINGLITALGKGTPKEEDVAGKDGFPPKKDDKNGAPGKEVPVTKPAMDAAIADATRTERVRLSELFVASEAVQPLIGKVDTLAFDSAADIYKLALDNAKIDTKDVHPSAFKSLLALALDKSKKDSAPTIAVDSAAIEDFEKRYPNAPVQA
jgi:uncharacterized protein